MAPDALPPLPVLPEGVRAGLPAEVQAYLTALEQREAAREAQLAALATRVAELEARRGRDSRTSSRPPSSDPPWKSRPPRPPSGRQRGGQPGHEGQSRLRLEPEAVDAVVEHWPTGCPRCQAALVGQAESGEAQRQQVWELPEARAQVTEHRLHAVRAERPADGAVGACGPRLSALVGLLHGRYRVSAREVVALLAGVWQVPLSLGGALDAGGGGTGGGLRRGASPPRAGRGGQCR